MTQDIKNTNNSFQDGELVRISLEKLQIPALWIDELGKIVKANASAPFSLDYTPDEFLKLFCWEVDESISKETWADHFESVKKHGFLNFHSRYKSKNSALVPVEVNIHFIESDGREYLFVCAADMRERKDILRTLSESEIKFRSLMETTSAAIFIYQGDKFKYANPAMQKLTGYSPEELYQMDFWQNAHPDSRELLKDIGAARIAGAAVPSSYEMRFFTKNGDLRWLDVTAGVIDYNSKPAVIVTALDVTERKAAGEILETKVSERTAAYRKIHQELENNKNFLDAVINSIADPVFVKNEDHKWVLLNDSYCDFMGYSREDILGRSDLDFFPPDESAVFRQKDEMVLKTGLANENEEKFTDSKGNIHLILTKKSLFIDNFKNKFIVGVLRDITEIKKTQEDIAENLRLVEALISSMPHPVFYKDRKKKYIGFNNAFCDFCGNDSGGVVGKDIFEVFPPDIASKFNEEDVKLLENGGSCVNECRLYNYLMNEYRDMLITKSAFGDASGSISGIIGTMIDITEQKKNEEALRFSEAKYRTILENTESVVLTYDTEGVLTYASPKVMRFGYRPEDLIGRNIMEFVHAEDIPKVMDGFQKILENGIDVPVTFRSLTASGEYILVEESGGAIRDENGKIIFITSILRDITEKRKMEEEIIRTSKLESLGILAGGIAHDFNNVLMGVIGNLNLAKRRIKSDEKTHEILLRAENVAYKAKKLTEQLITFSKGGVPIKSIAFIGDIVRESSNFALSGANVTCRLKIDEDLWPCEADESQIAQVVTNLVINAQQAMADGGSIEVECANAEVDKDLKLGIARGKYITISVADHGCGIKEEIRQKIFDPYFTTKKTGSGLGLSTSYSIIKNHGGTITVESRPMEGSVFKVYLPAAGNKLAAGKTETEAFETPALKKRILVMDDDETVLLPLYEMLSEAGHEVKIARDGAEAVSQFIRFKKLEKSFDLIIMDLVVKGGLGGCEAIKKIREIDPSVKAIVSSGYSNDPVMSDPANYGFCGVLVKPYRSGELIRAVERAFAASI